MGLRQRVDDELQALGDGRDGPRLSVVRALAGAIKVREIELARPLEDVDVQAVASELVKQRSALADQLRGQGDAVAADLQAAEIRVLENYSA